MKKQLIKWTFRLTITALFIATLLLIIVLNPILTYANKTKHDNFTIYHNTKLDPSVIKNLDHSKALLKRSEIYNDQLKLDICLNDGSNYTKMVEAIRGKAFAWGFYDKVVLQGTMDLKNNFVELNGYKWNSTQLLAHEMVHCLQFNKLGFWKSKPIANIANWKWEGYAEYIARQTMQKSLEHQIQRLDSTSSELWAITMEDSTIVPIAYYKAWNLVQYCIEVKRMSFKQIIENKTSEAELTSQMNEWYHKIKKRS